MVGNKINETDEEKHLKFNDNDLVYGPKSFGKLRELQVRAGGNLLEDVCNPNEDSFKPEKLFTLSKIGLD
ncbi:MAG: hypothetical protein FWH05_09575 [Oscillospiraceae bacterium]|nr:hypothetical protein [Oscillospiraceae bacterium]